MRVRYSRLWHTWVPLALVLLLYIVTFGVILPRNMKDKVYSVYFDGNAWDPKFVRMANDYNTERLTLAEKYLKEELTAVEGVTTPRVFTELPENPQVADIAIGIISLQRSAKDIRLGYLTQVASAFHDLCKMDTLFARKHLFICNVDPSGEDFQEATKWSPLVDVVVKFPAVDRIKNRKFPNIFEKEKKDYIFCLNKTLMYNTTLTVLVEDDSLPKRDFFPALYQVLRKRELLPTTKSWRESNLERLGFVKLFFPLKWGGYGNELSLIIELVCLGLSGGMISLAVFSTYHVILYIIRGTWCVYSMMSRSHLLSLVLGTLYTILLIWSVGRPYVTEYIGDSWKWYWTIPARNCCTPAVLYSRPTVQTLVPYLDKVKCTERYGVDLALDEYASTHNLATWLVEPNLVRHIGMHSTLRNKAKKPAEFVYL